MNQPSDQVTIDKSQAPQINVKSDFRILVVVARFVFLVFVSVVALFAGVLFQGYVYFSSGLPSIEGLKDYKPPIVSCVYDDQGTIIAEYAHQRRYVVPIEDIPRLLQQAFVAAEDKNFFSFRWEQYQSELWRCFLFNLMGQQLYVGGGSIIDRQVAKNFLLTPDRKLHRKIKEIFLTLRMEKSLTRSEILNLYLNQIYLGSGAYGVEAAARTYFGKHVKDLSIAECAMIAGQAKGPSRYNPRTNLQRALERRSHVLKRMREDRYISQDQHEAALQEEVKLAPKESPFPTAASDLVEHVRRYVLDKYGSDALYKEGLQIYTTCNLHMTRAAVDAVEQGLRDLDKRQGYRGPLKTLSSQEVTDYREHETSALEAPLQKGLITDGVVTRIDDHFIQVSMGRFTKGTSKIVYVGQIPIDPSPVWWCRKPYLRAEKRRRTFAQGDLPFQVGDLITVRLGDNLGETSAPGTEEYGSPSDEPADCSVERFSLELEQEPLVQAAAMLRENRSGHVKAVVGSRVGSGSAFNRATQVRRRAGSLFQPVIYAAALNEGYTCADVTDSSPPLPKVPGTGETWRPQEFGDGEVTPISLRDSLVHSKDIPAIRILQQMGLNQAKMYARKLGYTCALPDDLNLAVGNVLVSLEEHVNVFSVFPNNGYAVPGLYIRKIVDRNGRVLEEHHPPVLCDRPAESYQTKRQPDKTFGNQYMPGASTAATPHQWADKAAGPGAGVAFRVIDESIAQTMTGLLQGVVQEGTASRLKNILDRPDIAGKTGTTAGTVDAWFVGFSSEYTAGVWVGFDDDASMGKGETGAKIAVPMWGAFMKTVLKDQ
jgi:penicillin-binding protein 1A